MVLQPKLIGIFLIFVEDDPADMDFEPDGETDKATDKVIYLLNCSACNDI
jgi:hypothetical protein